MKFIVDAQLPRSLSIHLCSKGHDSIHTLDFSAQNKTQDSEINEVSLSEQRIVITKDRDFLDSFLINRKPFKLILLKTGNISNNDLLSIFENHLEWISNLMKDNSLIEINRDELIVHV